MHCPVKASVIRSALFSPFFNSHSFPPLPPSLLIFLSLNKSISLPPSFPHAVLTLRPSQPRSFWGNTFSLVFLSLSQSYCVQRDMSTWTLWYFYLLKTRLMKNTLRRSRCWVESFCVGQFMTHTLNSRTVPRKCLNQGAIVYIYVILYCCVKTLYSLVFCEIHLLLPSCS